MSALQARTVEETLRTYMKQLKPPVLQQGFALLEEVLKQSRVRHNRDVEFIRLQLQQIIINTNSEKDKWETEKLGLEQFILETESEIRRLEWNAQIDLSRYSLKEGFEPLTSSKSAFSSSANQINSNLLASQKLREQDWKSMSLVQAPEEYIGEESSIWLEPLEPEESNTETTPVQEDWPDYSTSSEAWESVSGPFVIGKRMQEDLQRPLDFGRSTTNDWSQGLTQDISASLSAAIAEKDNESWNFSRLRMGGDNTEEVSSRFFAGGNQTHLKPLQNNNQRNAAEETHGSIPQAAPISSSSSRRAKEKSGGCYNCGDVGHKRSECPLMGAQKDPGNNDDGPVLCFNCGSEGHMSRSCTRPTKDNCYQCGKSGHLAKECREGDGRGQMCRDYLTGSCFRRNCRFRHKPDEATHKK